MFMHGVIILINYCKNKLANHCIMVELTVGELSIHKGWRKKNSTHSQHVSKVFSQSNPLSHAVVLCALAVVPWPRSVRPLVLQKLRQPPHESAESGAACICEVDVQFDKKDKHIHGICTIVSQDAATMAEKLSCRTLWIVGDRVWPELCVKRSSGAKQLFDDLPLILTSSKLVSGKD